MSSFKNAAGAIDDIRLQATGKKNLEESTIADFLSIAGYEDLAGGGGGKSTVLSEIFPVCAKLSFIVSGVPDNTTIPFVTLTGTGNIIASESGDNYILIMDEYALTSGEWDVYLLSTLAEAEIDYDKDYWTITVSGDAEIDNDGQYWWIMVHGDCTITATFTGT